MCNPAIALAAAGAAEWYMGEQQRKATRESATLALKVGRRAEAMRQTEEMQAAELERDKIRRKTAISTGQLAAIGARRGTSTSNALQQSFNEFQTREGEYQSAISSKRKQQMLSGQIRDASRIATWQGRMMQNKSTGILGLAVSAGTGYMKGMSMMTPDPDVGGAFDATYQPTSQAMLGQPQTYGYQQAYGVGPMQSAIPGTPMNPFYTPAF